MKNVCVFFATGFEEIEAISIVDILRRANIPVTMVSITDRLEVTGSHQIKVVTDKLFHEVDFNDALMLVLPGGMPGSKNLSLHDGLKRQILNFNENNKLLGAICAAPLVFGGLGILKNKEATCYPGFEDYLLGASITKGPVTVAGNIITGKGPGVAIKFALKIVEILEGKYVR
jgi:4-methyl-5(b-hydroxyethyl)-thiazole monophosphate biosynthesis